MSKQEFRVGPAFIFRADEVFNRNADIRQPRLVHFMRTIDQLDRLHFDARRVHVDKDEADAFLRFLRRRVRTAEEESPIRVLRQRGPGLLAIQNIMVAVANRCRLEACKVRTCAWLGIALAPPHFAGPNAWQVTSLLLFIAECVDNWRNHRHTEWQRHQRINASILFRPDIALGRGPAGAAVFFRPCRC